MNESENRYITLRDLSRLFRDQAVVIILSMVACAAAAAFVASRQTTEYTTQSQVQIQDTSQALNLVGTPIASSQTPAQLAAQGAATLVTPELLTSVKQRLGLSQSVGTLRGMVSVQPDSSSNLLHISATAPRAKLAANIANVLATTASAQQRRQARTTYAAAATRLQTRYRASNPRKDPASRAIFDERLSQLQALASVADPLQVVSAASVPSSPASPKPVQDGVIGGLLGILLGLLIAIMRNALDRRLRGSVEIQREIGFPLLGHVRSTALGYAGDVPRGEGRLSAADIEAFRILRTNTEFLSENGAGQLCTFAVTSALPQEGKSTTAMALAFAYASSARRTLLVECDLRRPCFAERLGLPTGPGLTDYLDAGAGFEEVVHVARTAVERRPHKKPTEPDERGTADLPEYGYDFVDNGDAGARFGGCPDVVLAGPSVGNPAEELGSARLAEFLAEAKSRYKIVILDTPPLLSVADTLEILPRVEGQIICVRAQQTTRDQLAAAADALRRLPTKPTGLVVTGETKRDDARYGYYGHYHD